MNNEITHFTLQMKGANTEVLIFCVKLLNLIPFSLIFRLVGAGGVCFSSVYLFSRLELIE